MSALPTAWQPLSVEALKEELRGFPDWVLCGGHAVARITGEDTRPHGDIDVGVFRSQLKDCLNVLGRERVQLCRHGAHVAWEGGEVPVDVHDIWITDCEQKYWVLQVMVFDDEGDRVIYRRDRRISWPKAHHAIEIEGLRVLNPLVGFLFKTNKSRLEDKEVHDVMQLIKHLG
ncbi:MAG: hypothetical protein K9N01_05495 [Cephaloticoccus sp.]|nr:hypothetical protein [Cephaloticoccus sp.]